MKIDVIIPNFNGAHLIKKNLPSVISSLKKYTAHIIIVDDYSESEDYDKLDAYIQTFGKTDITISLLRNRANLGFAPTVNKGVQHGNGDFIVLLNTDVRPESDFLESVIPRFAHESIFAVGCMDRSIENGKEVLRGRGIGKWERGLLVHNRGEISKDNTLWVSGGSGIFRRSIWEKIGGLNALYSPFYWEDIDLSYRAQKAGYEEIFDCKSIVINEHEEGAIKRSRSEYEVKKISYRNQFIFIWLNVSDTKLIISHFLWLPYHILNGIVKNEFGLLAGFASALVRLPKILKERRRVQLLKKKSDQAVISAVQS